MAFDRRWGNTGCTPVLLAISVVGLYYTVPDPGDALVVLGVALPIAMLGWPWPVARLGSTGGFAVAGLLAWVVVRGGSGRQSSIVGGMACLGLLAIEPVARRFRRRAWSPLDLVPEGLPFTPVVAGVHLALVWIGSRLARVSAIAPLRPHEPTARGPVAGAFVVILFELITSLIVVEALRIWSVRRLRSRSR
jgi:hypothetical protein